MDEIRARYVEADAEASDQYQPHVRKIRRSLDDIPDLIARVEDLRAVLARILDDPFIAGQDGDACAFCLAGPGDRKGHDDDCPVRRRDELLGRSLTIE